MLAIAQQDFFEQALDLIQRGSYRQAVPLLIKAAESGNEPQAAFFLSQAYRGENGLERNDSLTDVWLLRAASGGYTPAFPGAASILLNNRSAFFDSIAGVHMLRTCANQKQAHCQLALSRIFLTHKNKRGALDSALVLLKSLGAGTSLTDNGELLCRQDAIETLIDLYENPSSKIFDEITACAWFLIWTANMELSQPANKELYFTRGKKLCVKLSAAKIEKARLLAENIIKDKIVMPEGLPAGKGSKP